MLSFKDVYDIILKIIKTDSQTVCKHYVGCSLLSAIEDKGGKLDMDLVKAMVDADDEAILSILDRKQ